MRKNYFTSETGIRKCDISGQGYLDCVTVLPKQIDKLVNFFYRCVNFKSGLP